MKHTNSDKAIIIYKTIGEILREERERQKKSQRILADEYDIQKSLISRLENGINEPKIISLWSICNALDLKIDDLFKKVRERLPEDFILIDN